MHCSRTTFAEWAGDHGRPWHGPGCPGRLPRRSATDGPTLRVALGGGSERWMDELVGPCADEVAGAGGDMPVRDRDGNWTYGFAVAVDDLRQSVDLVVRGRDLLAGDGRPRSGSHACSGARRRRRSPITGWSGEADGAKLSKADRRHVDPRPAGGRADRPSSSARRLRQSG